MSNIYLIIFLSVLLGLTIGGYFKLAITEKYYRVRYIGLMTFPIYLIMVYPCYNYVKKEIQLEKKKKRVLVPFIIVYCSSYNDFSFILAEASLKLMKISINDNNTKIRTFKNTIRKEWYEENDEVVAF